MYNPNDPQCRPTPTPPTATPTPKPPTATPTPAPPPPPSNISATATGRTTVELSWDDLEGASRYGYQQSLVATGARGAGAEPRSVTTISVTVDELECGATYSFRVRSHGDGIRYAATWGNYSFPPATATTDDCPDPPPPPSNISATATGRTTVELSWDDLEGASRYGYRQSLVATSARGDGAEPRSVTKVSVTVDELECGTTYSFSVRSFGDSTTYAAEWGVYSSPPVVATTDDCLEPPPPPSSVSATATGRTTVELSWDDLEGASRYRYRQSLVATSARGDGAEPRSVTKVSVTVDKLECETTYSFSVRSFGDGTRYAAEWGDYSFPPVTATTHDCLVPPPPPSNISATATGRTTVELSWDSLEGASRYGYQQDGGDPSSVTTSSATVDELECGTTYSFNVRSFGNGTRYAAEWGDYSSSVAVRTHDCPPPPPPPSNISAIATGRTTVELSWDDLDGASRYGYRQSLVATGARGAGAEPRSVTTISVTADGLSPGTTYSFSVRSYGDGTRYAAVWGDYSFPPVTATTHEPEPVISITGSEIVDYEERRTDAVATYTISGPEGVPLTVSLTGSDHGDFSIDATGRLTFNTTPDYEDPQDSNRDNQYSVTVQVSDGRDAQGNSDTDSDAEITVTVNVLDVPPPGKPAAPTVSGNGQTGLRVSWSAPSNEGPPITDYDVQYREKGASVDFTDADHSGTGTQLTLSSLESGTCYEAQVQATSAEGTGPWSDSGSGCTPSDDPYFPEGDTAVRGVHENTVSGEPIGSPVSAIAADPADTLTYSLTGTDAGSFGIDTTNGQLRTKAPLDYEVTSTYSVTVEVTDGEDADGNSDTAIDGTIDVTINIVDVPPPDPPGPT